MNRVTTVLAGIALGLAASPSVLSASDPRPAPGIRTGTVQEIFGDRLKHPSPAEAMLLLGIGIDYGFPDSPFTDQRVGVPYIGADGPTEWVRRQVNGEARVDVWVNNALMLLFMETDEFLPSARTAGAVSLLEQAASVGYWPAEYFLADRLMATYDIERKSSADAEALAGLLSDAQARYARCAAVGFAPCQFRLGFWAAQVPGQQANAARYLITAIETTRNDPRYRDQDVVREDLQAALELLDTDALGLPSAVRERAQELRVSLN